MVAVAIIGGYYAHKKEQERRRLLAARRGWRFDPSRDTSHDDEYAHFEVFRKGHSRAAYNTLTGVLECGDRSCAVKCGDFTYKETRGSGKNRRTTTYRISYMIIHLPWPVVPDVLVRREHMFDKLAGFLGFEDIDFESAEFSRLFYVSSKDKRFAYDLIDARMMEFLMASAPPVIDMEFGRICLTSGSGRWEPGEFETRASWLVEFLERWPRHVVAQLQSTSRV